MRRHAFFFALATLPWLTTTLPAQDAPPATPAPAVRSVDPEDVKSLYAKIEDLTAANEALQKSVNKLRDDLQRIVEEVNKPDRNKEAASADALEQLKSAIKTVDDKRLADQKHILAEFDKLQENLRKILEKGGTSSRTTSPGSIRSNPATTPNNTSNPAPKDPENGSTYQIRDGDTLVGIVADLKKHGVKITQKEIMDANPKVNWTRLRIGQPIFIPVKISP